MLLHSQPGREPYGIRRLVAVVLEPYISSRNYVDEDRLVTLGTMGPTVRLGLALDVAVGVFAFAKLALVNDGVAFHVAFNLNHLL